MDFTGSQAIPERAVLRVSNNEAESDVAFDCVFEKKSYLDVQCGPTVLQPGQSIDVPVTFTARAVQEYEEEVQFEVNGLYTVNVVVAGEPVGSNSAALRQLHE